MLNKLGEQIEDADQITVSAALGKDGAAITTPVVAQFDGAAYIATFDLSVAEYEDLTTAKQSESLTFEVQIKKGQ